MTLEPGRGRVTVVVESNDRDTARAAADAVAASLGRDGRTVIRASAHDFVSGTDVDHPFLMSALLDPFQAGEGFPLVGSRADGDILFDPLWTSAPADAILVVESRPAPKL